jgi:hypothetical protein
MTAVQQLMGHSNITTTMRYAHLAPSTLRAAIDMLNPKTMAAADFGQLAGNPWIRTQQKQIAAKIATPKNASFSCKKIDESLVHSSPLPIAGAGIARVQLDSAEWRIEPAK